MLPYTRRIPPLAVALYLSGPDGAFAFEATVGGTFDAQYYQVSSPYGSPLVRRRRYTQTLQLDVNDIVPRDEPLDPRLDATVRLRLDTDLGIADAEVIPEAGNVFVPGLQQAPLDLMVAYVDGRHYFDGVLGFRVGRQYVTDVLGWWSFDGAKVQVRTPIFVTLETYAGFEQRGGLRMLSTRAFEPDGVFRGNRDGFDANQWPEFLEQSRLAPAYGFAVETSGVSFLDARATYRKVLNRDRVVLSPFPDDAGGFATISDTRTSTERVGAAAVSTAAEVGTIHGSAVYDLYLRTASEHALGLDWFVTDDLSVGTAYDYYRPSFDGDSIFNWFTHHGMLTVDLHSEWRLDRRWSTAVRGGVRRFSTDEPEEVELDSSGGRVSLYEPLGHARVSYDLPAVELMTALEAQGGRRTRRVGADVGATHRIEGDVYDASWLLSLYDFRDAYRPDRGATSFTYVLGGGIAPFRGSRVGVEWEHSMNAVSGQRFRLHATLEVRVR